MRKKPYTQLGIKRVPCFRCNKPSKYQWNICSDGNIFRGLCEKCDIGLNKAVLKYLKDPDWEYKIQKYKEQARAATDKLLGEDE